MLGLLGLLGFVRKQLTQMPEILLKLCVNKHATGPLVLKARLLRFKIGSRR